jgi:SNF2 family DNA or RNA helicase
MVERQSMLVAFDMGLGKTPMTIAAIERMMDDDILDAPVLVVALSSLKYQWKAAVEKFSTDSRAFVIDGTKSQRISQYKKAVDWEEQGIDYVVVNYEQVVNDWDWLRKVPLSAVVCDEATAIKSFRSKRSKKIKTLVKDIPIRFALTGTPIENGKPEELFSIMQFVDDTVLGRFDYFDRAFIVRNQWGGVSRYRNLNTLHTALMDVCVRKSQTDDDVAPYLPDVIERDPTLIPMDRRTAKVYDLIADSLIEDLDEAANLFGGNWSVTSHYGGKDSDFGGPADALRGQIMSKVTALRMLCDHPELVRISATKFIEGSLVMDDEEVSVPGAQGGSAYLAELASEGVLDNLTATPKLDYLIQYLSDFLDTDETHKAVVFSAFVPTTDLIQQRLKVKSEVYTGKMNAKQKEAAKIRFQTEPDVRVLISSDAGGYGVDLPQANLLINYDLPWSSGLAGQRNARIVRASSEWPSVVIDTLLIAGSLEERQHDMLLQKNAIADAIIDGDGINVKGGVDLTVGSLKEFILTSRPSTVSTPA